MTALKAMTTPGQQPYLHYWDTNPEAQSWAAGKIADLHFEVCEALRPAFAAVIADHVEYAAPVVPARPWADQVDRIDRALADS